MCIAAVVVTWKYVYCAVFKSTLSRRAYGETQVSFARGELIKGTIVQLEAAGALIDIGAKTTAFMAAREVRRHLFFQLLTPLTPVLLVLSVRVPVVPLPFHG